jgi:glycosyltransferase involved in cell wall biosynthesis
MEDDADWLSDLPTGRNSQFLAEFNKQLGHVDLVRPHLAGADRYRNILASFHPSLERWRAQSVFNEYALRKRTEVVDRALKQSDGYDLIVQLQTICVPGSDQVRRVPYVIYTDNTMALTQRYYPKWASLPDRRAARWMEIEAEICQGAARVFAKSEFCRGSVVDDYGCDPSKVVAVGGGANQSLTDPPVDKSYATPRALFVGIDFERKGGHFLLEAWESVVQRVPGAELVVAGPPRDHRKPNATGIVWEGTVDRRRLAQLYRQASLFILPSLFEPWGLVFQEAMANALPCIGSSCCAMPEIINEGETGRLVPPGDASALGDAIVGMLAAPDELERMGRAAYVSAMNRDHWSAVAGRAIEHLDFLEKQAR